MTIRPPSIENEHPDYQLACEEAIDVALRELIDTAIVAGWRPETVFPAAVNIVTNQHMAYRTDPNPADD